MEVIDHQPGPRQAGCDTGGIAPIGIDGHGGDARQPGRRLGLQPGRNRCCCSAFDHVDEPMAVQVDEPGDHQGRMLGGGSKERGLVQAEGGRSAEAGQVVHPRGAVVDYRCHGRVPADAEFSGHLGDRVTILADLSADLGSGSLGERRTRAEVIGVLAEADHRTVWLRTAPDPLAPHQHDRPNGHRQISDLHHPPAVAHGPSPARRAAGNTAMVSTSIHSSRCVPSGRRPRTRACRAPWSLPRYGVSPSRASSSEVRTNRRIARPLAALVDPMTQARSSLAPTLHRGEPILDWVEGVYRGSNLGSGAYRGQKPLWERVMGASSWEAQQSPCSRRVLYLWKAGVPSRTGISWRLPITPLLSSGEP